jgi:putative transposase
MSSLRSMIDCQEEELSIRDQCKLLGVNRSSLYYETVGESSENIEVMNLMDIHFMENPTYGVLQMQDYLRDKGFSINIKRIRRLLRKMGIMAIYPQRNLSKMLEAKYIHPYLIRNMTIDHRNQVWAIDITYIPMAKGFMYLTAIIDIYSRYVVGWGLSNTLAADASIKVLNDAILTHGKPEIVNSDQGSQFTCEKWVKTLNDYDISISMDGRGRALDNIYIERLWRTVKRDYVYLNPAEDGWELFKGLQIFFNKYNYKKHHQGISREIPYERYKTKSAA